MATHSSILAWETPWTEEPGITGYSGGGYSPGGCKEPDTTEHTRTHTHTHTYTHIHTYTHTNLLYLCINGH